MLPRGSPRAGSAGRKGREKSSDSAGPRAGDATVDLASGKAVNLKADPKGGGAGYAKADPKAGSVGPITLSSPTTDLRPSHPDLVSVAVVPAGSELKIRLSIDLRPVLDLGSTIEGRWANDSVSPLVELPRISVQVDVVVRHEGLRRSVR